MSNYRQNKTLPEKDNSSEAETGDKPTPKAPISSSILDTLEMFVFALCVVVLILTSVFRLCTVSGASMENTFYAGEKLIISNFFYTPKRADVIVFHQTGKDTGDLNEPLVKRVIATEGETVSIQYQNDKMIVSVTDLNGNVIEMEEDYVKYEGMPIYASQTVTVPENHVFVMGDNRNNSKDSRHPQVDFVDERRILGKVVFRLTPFSRMGVVS
ncbi:MAG: signal peptidase I [Clostridia bacterium]|nr:signal peptidase I [Clostridia bacterium]